MQIPLIPNLPVLDNLLRMWYMIQRAWLHSKVAVLIDSWIDFSFKQDDVPRDCIKCPV